MEPLQEAKTEICAYAKEQNLHEGTWTFEFHKPGFKLYFTEDLYYDTEQDTDSYFLL